MNRVLVVAIACGMGCTVTSTIASHDAGRVLIDGVLYEFSDTGELVPVVDAFVAGANDAVEAAVEASGVDASDPLDTVATAADLPKTPDVAAPKPDATVAKDTAAPDLGPTPCQSNPACSAGASESQNQGCGQCGTQSRTRQCNASCQWDAFGAWSTCGNEGACAAGQVASQSQTCNANGCGSQSQTRTCSASCQWGAWGAFEACQGGQPEVDAAPPGTSPWRFDVETFNCSACGAACGLDAKCWCQAEFAALNYPSTHFMGLASETYRKALWAKGNYAAFYVNEFLSGYKKGGPANQGDVMADTIEASAKAAFPSSLPSWFLINEISSSLWPADADYRAYVVAMATKLSGTYKHKVVVFAPFATPATAWAEWASLAKVAYVGAESYGGTTGKAINASGNSVTYVQGQYQATIDAYVKVGVPKSKLFITEHYGNTDAILDNGKDCTFGRCGVSKAGWLNAIAVRNQAIQALGVTGVVTYGWAGNQVLDTSATRIEFIQKYAADVLP